MARRRSWPRLTRDLPLTPLAGRGIVITRPARQAAGLAALIDAAGGHALRYPTIEIEPLRTARLDALLGRLADYDVLVFISRNAVEQGLARIRESGMALSPVPGGPVVAAIGAGTRRALETEGFATVIAPEGPADSEALLAEPALANVSGKRIAVFRGEGGRETLAAGLRARGATVDYAECYRRRAPALDPQPLVAQWLRGEVHAVTVSSGEGLANLAARLGEAARTLLVALPVFVPHPRVAEQARALGVADVVVSGAADEDVLAALVAYFRRTG
ncbi:MAG: uroporphyrinogen-III synthase [Betaproteobacteria bacterium]|nr:uroporphyrinogen-III synthase [Betaproteobacteria bacterium]